MVGARAGSGSWFVGKESRFPIWFENGVKKKRLIIRALYQYQFIISMFLNTVNKNI